ncbi:hypothetical protein BH23ACT8_BH23ACT8_06620 [soil metagenome]
MPAVRVAPRLLLVVALLAGLLVTGAAPAPAQVASAEQQFVDKINAQRAAKGMAALSVHVGLVEMARDWTARMERAGGISHRSDLAQVAPSEWQRLGENVGRSAKSGASEAELVQRLHEAFMNSAGHRANIVGDFNFIGTGVRVSGDGTMWVTVNFMKAPASAAAPPPPSSGPAPAPPPPDAARPPASETAPVDVSAAVDEAVRVSRAVFGDAGAEGRQAEYVVLARGDVFADALGGSALAADRAPILYTSGPSGEQPDPALVSATRAEIDRVLGRSGRVYLLGGAEALSGRVAAELDGAGYDVQRLSGASRVETAVAVATEAVRLHGAPARVLIARSDDWADAVSGGAYAAATRSPMLLSGRDTLHPATKAFLDRQGGVARVALGGSAALSDATVAAAGASRVFGKERTGTAVAVAELLWGRTASADGDRFTLAPSHGDTSWAAALAQAPWAAVNDGPQLLAHDQVSPAVVDYLDRLDYAGNGLSAEVFAASAVPSGVVQEVRDKVGG